MIAACFIVLPLIVDFGSSTMNILILLFVYIILSQSWNLLGGYTGQINLGLAAYFGCGVLLTHLLWKSGVPIYFALVAGGLSAALLAGVIGLPTLHLERCLFRHRHDCLSRSIKNRSRECLPEFAEFTWQLRFQL